MIRSELPSSDLHILVAAYACNPRYGSEEGVGWNWVQAIARHHRVTVLTAAFHERDIAAVCDVNANPRFIFIPHRPWHYRPTPLWRKIENSIAKPIMNLAYAQWQRDAFRLARTLVQRECFDLVHQLTYVGYRFPGRLWKLGLPFVWGPIGGLENTPWRLLPIMGTKGAVYYAGRNVLNSLQRRFLRSPRMAIKAAGCGLIAATGGIGEELTRTYGAHSTIISEVVAPLSIMPKKINHRRRGEPFRIVWSGEHLPGKALNLLLEAISLVGKDLNLELHILGDGPMTRRWQREAVELGVDSACVWHGRLPREEALSRMKNAHSLVITSLKDLTSTVLLEGLVLGLPVICLNHCGFSDVVTEECGILIPLTNYDRIVRDLASAIETSYYDETKRVTLAKNALVRAKEYSMERKSEQIVGVYRKVLGACN